MDLQELRKEIDKLDAQIVELLQQRMDVAAGVAEYKRVNNMPVLDAGREQTKLNTIAAMCREDMAEYVCELYKAIFAVSRSYQEKLLEQSDG